MKKGNLILLFTLLFLPFVMQAQSAQDSVRLIEWLRIDQTDALRWITRYQPDIDKYTEENKQLKDKTCDVLFLGSSSINLWDNIYNDMSPLKLIRRSYGGAALRDMLYNYNVIARGYHPQCIVLYVENDITNSPEDITIGQTFDLFRIFIDRSKRDYPGVPFYVLSLKPSYAREKLATTHKIINTLLAEYANTAKDVVFVDVASCMYDENGVLRKDIFKADNLHLNQTGYDLWTARLKPLLLQHKK